MKKVTGSPFAIDYSDKEQVIAFANKLGKGMTVYKDPSRSNYNITHTSRTDQYLPDWVVFQTK
jgi:hypothetical protein